MYLFIEICIYNSNACTRYIKQSRFIMNACRQHGQGISWRVSLPSLPSRGQVRLLLERAEQTHRSFSVFVASFAAAIHLVHDGLLLVVCCLDMLRKRRERGTYIYIYICIYT